jgi:hypothetical protein
MITRGENRRNYFRLDRHSADAIFVMSRATSPAIEPTNPEWRMTMTKTYALAVRWSAFAHRVEYVSAISVEEACAIAMRGESDDLGDIEYFDDDASDHWIDSVEECVSDDPRVPDESLPVPVAYQYKSTPVEATERLLQACRMACRCLENGITKDTLAGADTIAVCLEAIRVAEEIKNDSTTTTPNEETRL